MYNAIEKSIKYIYKIWKFKQLRIFVYKCNINNVFYMWFVSVVKTVVLKNFKTILY